MSLDKFDIAILYPCALVTVALVMIFREIFATAKAENRPVRLLDVAYAFGTVVSVAAAGVMLAWRG